MCGIVGYVGAKPATPVLIEGLKRLEYRGYDSAGVALLNGQGIHITKRPGKIRELEKAVAASPSGATCGIAHTRWATHGAPTQPNAHPHTSSDGDIALVHNGIIENADVLRTQLQKEGYVFVSETDTEVVVHLIDFLWKDGMLSEEAVAAALREVDGAYGIAVISSRDPDKIVVARNGSPLLIGVGQNGEMLAGSDAAAVIAHTREVVYLDDGDYAVLMPAATAPTNSRAPRWRARSTRSRGTWTRSRRAATSTSCSRRSSSSRTACATSCAAACSRRRATRGSAASATTGRSSHASSAS
jgi:glutamine---fructose-6-phosphate transaminase (isomerizing)